MISSFPSPSGLQYSAGGTFLAGQQDDLPVSRVRRLATLITAVAVVGVLTACGIPSGQLKPTEQELVAKKQSSIVLLRLVAIHDGQPMEYLNKWNSMWAWPVRLMTHFVVLVENIDTGDQVQAIRTPTPEAEKEGWVYLVLEPGRYYLRVQPWRNDPVSGHFFLHVPVAGTVVYAGSLPFTCASPVTGWIMTNDRTSPGCVRPRTVNDESEFAARIAKASFEQFGFTTILMQRPK